MTRVVLAKLAGAVLTCALVSVLVFLATEAATGDAASAQLGGRASPAEIEALRHQLGLDRPAIVRFGDWLWHALHGDFGASYVSGTPVAQLVAERAGASAVLGAVTVVLLIPLALGLGTAAGLGAGGRLDRLISVTSLGLVSIPEFVVGALLTSVFAVGLGVLPAVSVFPAGENPLSHPEILVLPIAALLAVSLAQNVRLIRAGVAEVSASDAVESARLNGVPEHWIVWRMVLPVAVVPALPALARNISYLLGGTLVAETMFGYPGLAAALVEAVGSRDVPVVQAVALLVTVVTVALNLTADLLRVALDPTRGVRA